MQAVGPIIGSELVFFAIVERGNGGISNSVCDAADGSAKVRAVVGFVVGLATEALDDVLAGDGERLNDGAKRQEGDGVVGGSHDGRRGYFESGMRSGKTVSETAGRGEDGSQVGGSKSCEV